MRRRQIDPRYASSCACIALPKRLKRSRARAASPSCMRMLEQALTAIGGRAVIARRSSFPRRKGRAVERVPQRIVATQKLPVTAFGVGVGQYAGKRAQPAILALFQVAAKAHVDAHLDCDADRDGDDHVGREEDHEKLRGYPKFHSISQAVIREAIGRCRRIVAKRPEANKRHASGVTQTSEYLHICRKAPKQYPLGSLNPMLHPVSSPSEARMPEARPPGVLTALFSRR